MGARKDETVERMPPGRGRPVRRHVRPIGRRKTPPAWLGGVFPAVARRRDLVGLGAVLAVVERTDRRLTDAQIADVSCFLPVAGGAGPTHAMQQAARRIAGRTGPALAVILAALGHPHRITILSTLLEGPATYRLLQRRTRLKAGPLYHHVNQLRLAGLLAPKTRDLYDLTRSGRNVLLAALAMQGLLKDTRPRAAAGTGPTR